MKPICFLLAALLALAASAREVWEISMSLAVPRVYDNWQSLGYRKYQTQKLVGTFFVERAADDEPTITFCCLKNKTHKVNGLPVTYDVEVDSVAWHGIGSNKTDTFNTRSCVLALTAEPSYAIGPEPDEDNALIITLAGKGNDKTISGRVAGQIGCACKEYGHISPTRIWWTDVVTDTAAVFGTFTAKKTF